MLSVPMYPRECRESGISYAAPFYVTMCVQVRKGIGGIVGIGFGLVFWVLIFIIIIFFLIFFFF